MASEGNEGTNLPGASLTVRHYTALAALLIVVVDYLFCLRTEYRCIWRFPCNEVKLLYVVARYCSLASLLAHYILTQLILLPSGGHVSFAQCSVWFTFLGISCAIICAALNIILVLRAYALYTKNTKILALSIPLIGEFAGAMVISLGRFIAGLGDPQDRHLIWFRKRAWQRRFTPMCDVLEVPKAVIYIGPIIVVAQVLLWVITVLRRNVAEGRARVVKLVVWEGTWACILLCALVITLTTYSYTLHLSNPFFIFAWPICVVSVTACRLILNMQRLRVEPRATSTDDAWELTSVTIPHDDRSFRASRNGTEISREHQQQIHSA